VVFSAANPCTSLVSGVALAPGAAVKVDVTLKLSSSLAGHTAQGSVGGFDVKLTLTSTDVPAPSGCAAVTPPNPGGGGGGGGGGGHGSTTPPAGEIDTAVVSGAADGTIPKTDNSFPVSGGTGRGSGAEIIIPNTARFFQEFDVVGWLVALVLGGIFAWWWRRRREYIYPYEPRYKEAQA
jgi:hypothetical protein